MKTETAVVNGKFYPFWGQFLSKKKQFIGGVLEDFGDNIDRGFLGMKPSQTEITNIELKPNGDESAFFQIVGKDFTCGFDVKHGGVVPGEEGWITFSGYGGHKWRIKTTE